jgi:type II secretory ATPase GspE/PulE/Tfp pilus assembly ATPase PilB-like protein
VITLDKLGFSEYCIGILKRMVKRPEGVIILTGPTGSGKTTTLYTILNYINSIDKNIMTLEDPV